ncbi:MAG: hypothetical protein V4813_18665 [Gemmatimonadota bacterium]
MRAMIVLSELIELQLLNCNCLTQRRKDTKAQRGLARYRQS